MRLLTLLVSVSFLYGCAGNLYQPISNSALNEFKAEKEVDLYYQGANFWLQTTKSALGQEA